LKKRYSHTVTATRKINRLNKPNILQRLKERWSEPLCHCQNLGLPVYLFISLLLFLSLFLFIHYYKDRIHSTNKSKNEENNKNIEN